MEADRPCSKTGSETMYIGSERSLPCKVKPNDNFPEYRALREIMRPENRNTPELSTVVNKESGLTSKFLTSKTVAPDSQCGTGPESPVHHLSANISQGVRGLPGHMHERKGGQQENDQGQPPNIYQRPVNHGWIEIITRRFPYSVSSERVRVW